MGAGRVIALGRDNAKLADWMATYPAQYRSRISTYAMTSDAAADTAALLALTPNGQGADVFCDFSPPQIAFSPNGASHIKTVFGALAIKARVILMGGIPTDITIPYGDILRKDMTIVGGFMYDADVPRDVFRLVEAVSIENWGCIYLKTSSPAARFSRAFSTSARVEKDCMASRTSRRYTVGSSRLARPWSTQM